jgi:cyclophilin family peptidyl-prolyl cis-trans isomerase
LPLGATIAHGADGAGKPASPHAIARGMLRVGMLRIRQSAIAFSLTLLPAACGGGAADADADAGLTVDAGPTIDAGDTNPVVRIATAMGELVVELYPVQMPVTTANFLAYVDAGFYDGTLIHRVVENWVIQGGGYTTGLMEKPPNPPIPLEQSDLVSHVHGALSMARTNDPDSATSQWFIVDWPDEGNPPQPGQLDGNYAAFGVLIEGFDVLDAISKVPVESQAPLSDVPVDEIVVTSMMRL